MTQDPTALPAPSEIPTSEPVTLPGYERPALVSHGSWQMLTAGLSLEIGSGGD